MFDLNANTVQIMGRLAATPDSLETQSGTLVVKLLVGVDRYKRDQDGEVKTDWLPVTVLGEQGAECVRRLGRDSVVSVVGRLQSRENTSNDGRVFHNLEVLAQQVIYLSGQPADEPEVDGESFFGD